MGFLQDFLSSQIKKTYEDPEKRSKDFERRLDAALEERDIEFRLANMHQQKETLYSGLKFHPVYKQYSLTFPHKQYTRRPANE
jgi:ABC-type oligopeptide transport system substrate-binding subunit